MAPGLPQRRRQNHRYRCRRPVIGRTAGGAVLNRYLWSAVNRLLGLVEAAYQRSKRLQRVGPLFYIQHTTYEGPVRELEHGVRLHPGEPVGVLHFNNRGLQRAQTRGGHSGFVFARLMLAALTALAEAVERDPELQRLAGFHGITWIPPHGRRIGFIAEPLPDNWRNRLRSGYFRLLLYAFNPHSSKRFRGRLRPYEFWLSRRQLQEHFGAGRRVR